MFIKRVKAFKLRDSRKAQTIEVEIYVKKLGVFYSSAPNGKSRGKFEAAPYRKTIEGDIGAVSGRVGEIKFEKFDDLEEIEKMFKGKIGANTMIALEYCFLKALAYKNKKQVWQVINPKARRLPMPVGNAIGGGKHSQTKTSKPDFQEFLFIPQTTSFAKAVSINRVAQKYAGKLLGKIDKKFGWRMNDESAWMTSLDNESVMSVAIQTREWVRKKYNINLRLGSDIASSEFYQRKNYNYKNKKAKLSSKEQIEYMAGIAKGFYYLEDPLEQEGFREWKKLRAKTKNLIVGDDLTVTNLERLKRAVRNKAINAIIIKPNQVGSLVEVKKIVNFCKKNKIKMIFSHRSGETDENILADLAFGFQSDFIKTGIWGWGRKQKLKRLMEIERGLQKSL